ncbi:uracil-DNA glycosylase [Fusibacter sp. JL216-2]|uniref:uracil-DNA glycosylase n=1 Tax=Fusibacter sp. JL216-2 TaxID=3071453 RepID=UPI003D343F89
MKQVNCRKCVFFYITWDQKKPYGCKYFGFKSKVLPSVSVYKSSGEQCKAFTPKEVKPKKKSKNGFDKLV